MSRERESPYAVEWVPSFTPSGPFQLLAQPEKAESEGYYGLPMLKRPVWTWEIAYYFWFEGISAGAYVITTMAELFNQPHHREMIRAGRYLALATLLPCPPLLIADLGRPERFHHMLRIFKPTSPMNLGAWALTGYSMPVGLLAAKEAADARLIPYKSAQRLSRWLPTRLLGILGLPFAMTMISYPGVLLSSTSTPIWSHTRFLGALISSSSMSAGVAALSLVMAIKGKRRSLEALEKIEKVARMAEGATLTAYLATTRRLAAPLTHGKYAKAFWLGAVGAGLILPALIEARPKKAGRSSKAAKIVSSVLTLAGSLVLKWAIASAGRHSAEDPAAARYASGPRQQS